MEKIYFANYGDNTVKAYSSQRERQESVEEFLSMADDDEERAEGLARIEQYELEMDEAIDDDNLLLERNAIMEADLYHPFRKLVQDWSRG